MGEGGGLKRKKKGRDCEKRRGFKQHMKPDSMRRIEHTQHCVVVAPLFSIRRGEFRHPSKRKWSVCVRGHLGVITGSAVWQSDSNQC